MLLLFKADLEERAIAGYYNLGDQAKSKNSLLLIGVTMCRMSATKY
jgi:hypothetical protein